MSDYYWPDNISRPEEWTCQYLDQRPMLDALKSSGWLFSGVGFVHADYPQMLAFHGSRHIGDMDVWFIVAGGMISDLWDSRTFDRAGLWPTAEQSLRQAERYYNEQIRGKP